MLQNCNVNNVKRLKSCNQICWKPVELPVTDILDGIVDYLFDLAVILHHFLNLFNGIDNGGVMSAAEFFTDVCHWECCKLSWNINCNVSGIADVCTSVVFRTDSLGSNAESTGNFLDNALYGNLRRSIVIKNVWNNLLNRRNCNFLLIYEVFAFNF